MCTFLFNLLPFFMASLTVCFMLCVMLCTGGNFRSKIRRTGYRNGFTLVELLVVIAIIGVLIALLLPAVQAAREAARRMSCSNQVKQLSISLHNYHDVHLSFPAGGAIFLGSQPRFSAFLTLLPFIEQQPVYDAYLGAMQASRAAGVTPSNIAPWMNSSTTGVPSTAGTIIDQIRYTQIAALVCPSDPNKQKPPGNVVGRTSYAISSGDWAAEEAGRPATTSISDLNPRSIFIFGCFWRTMTTMTDGTSNTAVFSEKAIGGTSGIRKLRGGIAYVSGNPLNGLPTSATYCSVSACLTVRNNDEFSSTVTNTNLGGSNTVGVSWLDGTVVRNGFSTIIPPNGPSCGAQDGSTGSVREHSRAMPAASSYHPGGVQVGLGDGSVRFVSETINAKTAGGVNYCVTSGESPFGVWGALGSVNGGESTSLQ
jgi:prepilin-type N-terminal cleavage/methylation domain-containing protein